MKHTLWEGGVRGSGFLWSPRLNQSGYVSNRMMQVIDWLPTLLHAAGYDVSKLPKDLDGVDQWDVLSDNTEAVRTEILHNTDGNLQGLRVNEMKIIRGETENPGWYPPENFTVNRDIYAYEAPADHFQSELLTVLQSLGRKPHRGNPVEIQCGPKPSNASKACQSDKYPCLFNITRDPCEYYNLAEQYPLVLQSLVDRLAFYQKSAVPPRNKPADPAGYPINNDLAWKPWLNLTAEDRADLARKYIPL